MARNPLSEFEKKLRKEIADNLKKYTNGITQARLADMTGIPSSTLSGYFAERSTINAGNVQKIAYALNIEKEDIDPRFKDEPLFYDTKISIILNQLNDINKEKVYGYAGKILEEQNEADITGLSEEKK